MSEYLNAKGWLTPAERKRLVDLAGETSPTANILNIGVEYGASLVCLAHGNPKAVIWGVDLDNSKVEALPSSAKLITTYSQILLDSWSRPLELVFVDGDHSYDGAFSDAKFSKFVTLSGCIAFHDCFAWHKPPRTIHEITPEVNLAVDDWFGLNLGSWVELECSDSIRVFRRIR